MTNEQSDVRFFRLGTRVRVVATGETGEINYRSEPCVGVRYCLREFGFDRAFRPLELEAFA